MFLAPPIGTTAMPSAARSRPRRAAIASTATWSLLPSTSTTARGRALPVMLPRAPDWSLAGRAGRGSRPAGQEPEAVLGGGPGSAPYTTSDSPGSAARASTS